MISLRYLFEKRRERFISATALISILGIAIGVATLIVTIAVMNGFNNEIEEKILNMNPHIIIGSEGPIAEPEKLIDRISDIDGVLESEEFLDGQALINISGRMMGVLIRGIQPNPKKRLIKIENFLAAGSLGLEGNRMIVGSELANSFKLKIGKKISIMSPLTAQAKEFIINGIFHSGRYDYDLNMVFVNIDEARGLLGEKNIVSAIGLKVRDVFDVASIKDKIISFIKRPFWVITWKEIDKNLFSALKLEKTVMFILMALIVCIASFNIVSTLIMTVMEKTKDIGILKVIGATKYGIMSLFFLEGLYISIIGIITGTGLGIGLCYLQSKYELIKLPPDVYYIYSVPVQVRPFDTLIIIGAALLIGLAAAVYPSMHAARLDPVDALKYE